MKLNGYSIGKEYIIDMKSKKLIKVLIVDDSFTIRQELKEIIDWGQYGFLIIGEATNGKQGIEIYNKKRPDLIISDIKMPVMDGLAMINALHKNNNYPEFILLTAYEEFDYARKAINLNVGNYVLKHEVDSQSFIELLLKTKENIIKKHNEDYYKIDFFFSEILNSEASTDDLSEYLKSHNFALKNKAFYIAIFKIADEANHVINEIYDEFNQHHYQINVIARCFQYNYSAILISCGKCTEYKLIVKFLHDIASAYYKETDTHTVAALSDRFMSFSDIYSSHIDTLNNIKYYHIYEKKRIILNQDIIAKQYDSAMVDDLLLLLSNKFNAGDIIKILKILGQLETICLTNQNIKCFNHIKSYIEKNISILSNENQLNEQLFGNFASVKDFFEEIRSFINKTYSFNGRVLSNRMRKIISFINENQDKDISLNDIADKFGISIVYAGQLIKKELGSSYNKYLVRIRIERAKELLKSGDYKIYEISNMVGYNTVQYFSNIFKKATGFTPKDYIKLHL